MTDKLTQWAYGRTQNQTFFSQVSVWTAMNWKARQERRVHIEHW